MLWSLVLGLSLSVYALLMSISITNLMSNLKRSLIIKLTEVLSQLIRLFRMIDISVSSGDVYFYQIMDEKMAVQVKFLSGTLLTFSLFEQKLVITINFAMLSEHCKMTFCAM